MSPDWQVCEHPSERSFLRRIGAGNGAWKTVNAVTSGLEDPALILAT
jgi:hypothetical protein